MNNFGCRCLTDLTEWLTGLTDCMAVCSLIHNLVVERLNLIRTYVLHTYFQHVPIATRPQQQLLCQFALNKCSLNRVFLIVNRYNRDSRDISSCNCKIEKIKATFKC